MFDRRVLCLRIALSPQSYCPGTAEGRIVNAGVIPGVPPEGKGTNGPLKDTNNPLKRL